MKICIINGSPRKNGATGKVLRKIGSHLEKKEDVQVNYFDLNDYKMNYCCGCMKCFSLGECMIKEDGIEGISQELALADGIIIGSPTYASNITGQLKTFIDRGHIVMEQLFKDKYTFAVSTYENVEGRKVISLLNRMYLLSGGILCGSYLLKVLFNREPFENKRKSKELDNKIEKLYRAIKYKKKNFLFFSILHSLVLNIGLKPYVFKHKYRTQGIINKWKLNGTI